MDFEAEKLAVVPVIINVLSSGGTLMLISEEP